MADESNNKPKPAVKSEGIESQLKKLLTNPPPSHVKNENRVTVLVAVAKIDTNLSQLLLKRLAPSAAEEDELLADGRPLGSFVLKAKLARRLGIISEDFYFAIYNLSKIRNLCAHREEEFEIFSDSSVIQRVENVWSRLDPEFQSVPGDSVEDVASYDTKKKFVAITGSCDSLLRVSTKHTKPLSSAQREPIFAGWKA